MIDIPNQKRGNIASDLMPDLTPLLDVMFMLIVFFLLTANAVPYAMDVNLPTDPESITRAVEDPDLLSVTLLPDDQGWKINDLSFTREQDFKSALKEKAQGNNKVMIIGDKEVSIEKLLHVMAFLRKNNIEAADIVMEK
ncbi:MAG: biopolymer transporter ExbD [Alphaproteobacteria bacterium]|nr:biopolymer transporter ExbD [Alphaproteobacteria bacterium]NCQ88797.1 biopolymer transporter ExbD [Alphaproteobacteria bacterium]NCT07280.1 biopolymer transporter ExbD [Alphaproteobacteria bacterium]